jgi:very-short-patch-repair endonuclease
MGSEGAATPAVESPAAAFDAERIRAQLRKWQDRLLDLTRANPLLSIDRSRVSKLRISAPTAAALFDSFVVSEAVLRMPVVEKIRTALVTEAAAAEDVVPEDQYVVHAGEVTFDAKPIEIMRKLRRINDNSRITVEERGVTTLYLTFGTLVWDVPALGQSRSPLWLVPCQLESSGANAPLRLSRADEEMQLNPALELYLRERQKVDLPELPDEPPAGALAVFLAAVERVVQENRWSVEPEVWLSTYSFESLVLYQDLKSMVDAALLHPIVAALARASSPTGGSEALGEDQLDGMPTPGTVPIPVLPTDSSQLQGLAMAAVGRNLIVNGPPGTGKSQTISNLIADAIGANKKVLFVSAKMAALNVVYARLAERGLGRFCLEAHSTKAGKAKIMEELKRTLEAAPGGDGDRMNEQLEELLRLRSQLNTYVGDLHERRQPLGLSLHEAIGRIERLRNAPDVRGPLPWPDQLTVGRSDLAFAVDGLSDLAAVGQVFDQRNVHPWRGLVPSPGFSQLALESDLRQLRTTLDSALVGLGRLERLLGAGLETVSLAQLAELAPAYVAIAEAQTLPSDWAARPLPEVFAATDLLRDAADRMRKRSSKRSEYDASLAVGPTEASNLLAPIRTEFASWNRYFKPAFWRWRADVRSKLRTGASQSVTDLERYAALAAELIAADNWFAERDSALRREVPIGPLGPETLESEASALATAASCREAFVRTGRTVPTTAQQPTAAERADLNAIATSARSAELTALLERLHVLWPGGLVGGDPPNGASADLLTKRTVELLSSMPRLQEWLAMQHSVAICESRGLGPFLAAVAPVSATMAVDAFQRRFYDSWANAAIATSQALSVFAGPRREQQVERFRELDERVRSSKLAQIKVAAGEPARRINSAYSGLSNASEVGILRRELEKKRRIKPLRKLFAEIPQALQALKPCMLMSPLSVSTFLKPGAMEFDLVVFDEASQLPTQEAIPAILRAKQVVVAGDANQLPPSAFFSTADWEPEDENESDDFEPLQSLLDECVAIVPVFERSRLLWHYRSRDERLIKFSNREFYENSLITFPSTTTDPVDRGVRLVFVPDGIWDRGRSRTNRREASVVADTILEHFQRHPERSLGVVALNATQREAIEDAVKERLATRPNLAPLTDAGRAEPYFVKSLENVQGDERDTMIISVGYAKTADGSFSLNFGPLNQDGGWRRLNVLVTRAKWQTILVTSIDSRQLDGVNPNNRGAVALRDFIAYVERGGDFAAKAAVVTDDITNDFEDSVAEALRDRGLNCDQQVGASNYRIDIGIRDPRDPNRYLLGVECDGATYHSAKTARDRDLLRQQVLRTQGWRLHRLWSTDWFRDREGTLSLALAAYERALKAPIEESALGAPSHASAAPVISAEPTWSAATKPDDRLDLQHSSVDGKEHQSSVASQRRYPSGEAYRCFRAPGAGPRMREQLMSTAYVYTLAEVIKQVVGLEGPIHEQLLTDRLKELHGVARAGANIQGNIDAALRKASREGAIVRRGAFLYQAGSEVSGFRIPADGVERSVALVAPEELEFAVLHIVEDQFGYPRSALPRAVSELFGFERTRAGSAELIATVVDGLVERGLLRSSGPNVSIQ